MHYGAIKKYDIANGEGVRVSLFVSGCRNRCPGCFQPETWDFNYGKPFDEAAREEIFSALGSPSVRGLTVLGGEPMEPENQKELLPLLREVKSRFPNKTVWIYTGNLYEEITGQIPGHRTHTEYSAELLSLVDILVDGRFVAERKRLGLRFRGSDNQRIIDLVKTRETGILTIWQGTSQDKIYHSEDKNNED